MHYVVLALMVIALYFAARYISSKLPAVVS